MIKISLFQCVKESTNGLLKFYRESTIAILSLHLLTGYLLSPLMILSTTADCQKNGSLMAPTQMEPSSLFQVKVFAKMKMAVVSGAQSSFALMKQRLKSSSVTGTVLKSMLS